MNNELESPDVVTLLIHTELDQSLRPHEWSCQAPLWCRRRPNQKIIPTEDALLTLEQQ